MGMFDYFVIEDYSVHPELEKVAPTPDELESMKKSIDYDAWQTKSLDSMMDTYKLLDDGTILKITHDWDYGAPSDTTEIKEEPFPYHGVIRVHDYRTLEYHEEGDSKKTRWIALSLYFTSGKLTGVEIDEDKIEEHGPYKPMTLLKHIKEVVKIDEVKIERPTKYYIYSWVIQQDETSKQWAIFDNQHRVNLIDGAVMPYIPHEGPLYSYDCQYEAADALRCFLAEVQAGNYDEEELLQ